MRIKLIEVPEVPKLSIMYNPAIKLIQDLDFKVYHNIPNMIGASMNGYGVDISFGNKVVPGYSSYHTFYTHYTPLNLFEFYDAETDIVTMPNVFRDLGKNSYVIELRNAASPYMFPIMYSSICEYYDGDEITFSSDNYKLVINLNAGELTLSDHEPSSRIRRSNSYLYYEDSDTILQKFLNGEHNITITIKDRVGL